MSTLYNDPANIYVDSYDPTSSESVFENTQTFYYWINSDTKEIYLSTSPSNTDILWRTLVTSINLLQQIENCGWQLNTNRGYSPVSLSFNTGRMPNSDQDTSVTVTFSQTSTLLLASVVDIQVDSGSGFSTIATSSISGVASTEDKPFSFIVPAGASYKFVNSSGTNSIVSIKELSL